MSTAAQHRRGNAAMSRDIDARFVKRDPVIARLEASREIAIAERDKALSLVAELTAELQRARRCLAASRLGHDMAKTQWDAERADIRFKLDFTLNRLRRLEASK